VAGDCSLRQAVNAANGSGGADTITLPAASIVLSQNALPTITQDTRFVGKGREVSKITGADTVVPSASGQGGVFTLFGGTIVFERLSITGNHLAGSFNGGAGAVVASGVDLVFFDSAVTQNRMDATAINGAGGIANIQGVVTGSTTLVNTTVADNRRTLGSTMSTPRTAGGVLSVSVPLTIRSSTISGNIAGPGNVNTAVGGVLQSNAPLTIENSTVSGNSSQGGTVTQRGGGVVSDTGDVTLREATIADNFTSFDGALGQNIAAVGAGTRVLRNTVFSGAFVSCSGTWTSQGGNVEAGNSCPLSPAQGDKPFTNPVLAELADNGGPTLTRALGPESSAIDAGRPAWCSPFDQRGVTRPQINGCDSGAYEVGPPVNTAAPSLRGSAAIGQTLTCDPGAWRGAPAFLFFWLRDGASVPGNGASYPVSDADAGHAIQCRVSGGNAAGATTATSNALGVASSASAPTPVPVNSARPAISGASRAGQQLTCGPGTWAGGPSFAFRWLRNGAAIAGAATNRYSLVAGDVGKAIQCSVLATNAGGTVASDSAPRIAAQACVVPSLKAASLTSARSRLARAHCALGKVTRAFSTSVKSGRVIRSNPGAAANLAVGTKVGLQLSKGPKPRKAKR
jgi:hypothetical protein